MARGSIFFSTRDNDVNEVPFSAVTEFSYKSLIIHFRWSSHKWCIVFKSTVGLLSTDYNSYCSAYLSNKYDENHFRVVCTFRVINNNRRTGFSTPMQDHCLFLSNIRNLNQHKLLILINIWTIFHVFFCRLKQKMTRWNGPKLSISYSPCRHARNESGHRIAKKRQFIHKFGAVDGLNRIRRRQKFSLE